MHLFIALSKLDTPHRLIPTQHWRRAKKKETPATNVDSAICMYEEIECATKVTIAITITATTAIYGKSKNAVVFDWIALAAMVAMATSIAGAIKILMYTI